MKAKAIQPSKRRKLVKRHGFTSQKNRSLSDSRSNSLAVASFGRLLQSTWTLSDFFRRYESAWMTHGVESTRHVRPWQCYCWSAEDTIIPDAPGLYSTKTKCHYCISTFWVLHSLPFMNGWLYGPVALIMTTATTVHRPRDDPRLGVVVSAAARGSTVLLFVRASCSIPHKPKTSRIEQRV